MTERERREQTLPSWFVALARTFLRGNRAAVRKGELE